MPVEAADCSPAVEGRLRAAVAGRPAVAAAGILVVDTLVVVDTLAAAGILVVDTLVVLDTLAAAGDRPRREVESVFLGRAVPGRVGTPDLLLEGRGDLGKGRQSE